MTHPRSRSRVLTRLRRAAGFAVTALLFTGQAPAFAASPPPGNPTPVKLSATLVDATVELSYSGWNGVHTPSFKRSLSSDMASALTLSCTASPCVDRDPPRGANVYYQVFLKGRAQTMPSNVALVSVPKPPAPVITGAKWQPQTAMAQARYYHASATDQQGRIYALGQYGAERYTPTTKTWEKIADPGHRVGGSAVAAADGSIYYIGGWTFSGYLTSVLRYSPTTNTWASAAPLGHARAYHAAAVDSLGRIYAIGGANGPNWNNGLSSVERFDPKTGAWSTVAALPKSKVGLSAAADTSGNIYALGGSAGYGATTDVWKYSDASNTWSASTPLLTPRWFSASTTDGHGNIFTTGGRDGRGNIFTSTESFNPTTGSRTQEAGLNTGRAYLSVANSSGYVYAIGGIGPVESSSNVLASVERLG